jgi:hypothetical protein
MLGLGKKLSKHRDGKVFNSLSMEFNQTGNQDIDIDELAGSINKNSFSISAWVKLETTSSTMQVFRIMVGTDTDNHITLQYHAGGNEMRFTAKFGGTARVACQTSTTWENDGNWHHVVGSLNKAADEVDIWIDGVNEETSTATIGTLSGTFNKCSIASNTLGGGYWNGKIDEVIITTKVLSDAQTLLLYTTGKGINIHTFGLTHVIGWYRMEDGNGVNIRNKANVGVGSGNIDGTARNGPVFSRDVANPVIDD